MSAWVKGEKASEESRDVRGTTGNEKKESVIASARAKGEKEGEVVS